MRTEGSPEGLFFCERLTDRRSVFEGGLGRPVAMKNGRPGGRPSIFESFDGQGRSRTADTAIFSRVLYQLSYLAVNCSVNRRQSIRGSKLACQTGCRGFVFCQMRYKKTLTI